MVNGTARERIGNSVYGQYGQDFTSSDGVSFMVVALTGRHFRDLTDSPGQRKPLPRWGYPHADFTDEGQRYLYRDALTGLFSDGSRLTPPRRSPRRLSTTSVLWERYRTFADAVTDERVTANPMFTPARPAPDRAVPGTGAAARD